MLKFGKQKNLFFDIIKSEQGMSHLSVYLQNGGGWGIHFCTKKEV